MQCLIPILSMWLLSGAWSPPAPVPAPPLPDISVRDFGAVPDDELDDSAAIQRAINASRPGQRVTFEPGRYELRHTIVLGSGRSYVGNGAVLRSADLEFAAKLQPGASDVEIRGFRFDGAGIAAGDGSRIAAVRILGNHFTDIPIEAIKFTIPSSDVRIERNVFRNIRGYGAVNAFNVNRMSYSHNRLIDVTHGGHILGPLEDCTFSFNYMTGVKVMGLEIQRDSSGTSVSRNLTVEGNVIYDWRLPNGGSFGLSVIAEGGLNTRVIKNYIRANIADGSDWNPDLRGQGRWFGPGIESGFDTGIIEGNVIGGRFGTHIAVAGQRIPVRRNRLYGVPGDGAANFIRSWPGIHGMGSFVERNNVKERDFARMPPPPTLPAAKLFTDDRDE